MLRLFIILTLVLLANGTVQAVYDPLSVPNNKYGIHIADFNDIVDTAALINSNGGHWGYVTLVSTDNDRDHGKWQAMFNAMRRLHIIPIVRLATHPESNGWKKPDPAHIPEIVRFFNKLNWPTQNRYIILFNEPNHANEWGSEIDPEGYAALALEYIRTFKEASEDYFVLPAGLDVSAATDSKSLDAAEYLRRMTTSQPELINLFDGWTSHSYPNPAFSGSPYSSGRGTVRSFDWELALLRNLGLSKKLPVFITETGWVHNQGKVPRYGLLSPEEVGNNLKIASESVWSDSRIVAITPFVFNYQDVPFDNFSWKKLGNGQFYAQHESYKTIAKTKGTPIQYENYTLTESLLPPTLVSDSSYTLKTTITNNGQGILNPDDGYEMVFEDNFSGFVFLNDTLPTIEPTEKGELTIHLKTPDQAGTYKLSLSLKHGDTLIPLQNREVQIVPPPSIRVVGQLGWRTTSDASDITMLIYDGDTLIHKFSGMRMSKNEVIASRLTDIVPGKKYRIVLLVPYYLPRQSIVPLGVFETQIFMKRLYPLDFNKDGTFTPSDIWALITKPPHDMINLIISR